MLLFQGRVLHSQITNAALKCLDLALVEHGQLARAAGLELVHGFLLMLAHSIAQLARMLLARTPQLLLDVVALALSVAQCSLHALDLCLECLVLLHRKLVQLQGRRLAHERHRGRREHPRVAQCIRRCNKIRRRGTRKPENAVAGRRCVEMARGCRDGHRCRCCCWRAVVAWRCRGQRLESIELLFQIQHLAALLGALVLERLDLALADVAAFLPLGHGGLDVAVLELAAQGCHFLGKQLALGNDPDVLLALALHARKHVLGHKQLLVCLVQLRLNAGQLAARALCAVAVVLGLLLALVQLAARALQLRNRLLVHWQHVVEDLLAHFVEHMLHGMELAVELREERQIHPALVLQLGNHAFLGLFALKVHLAHGMQALVLGDQQRHGQTACGHNVSMARRRRVLRPRAIDVDRRVKHGLELDRQRLLELARELRVNVELSQQLAVHHWLAAHRCRVESAAVLDNESREIARGGRRHRRRRRWCRVTGCNDEFHCVFH
eukprot:comp22047_c0_seq1/m.50894 comp22047_c0_seq1/g.50894  ORF comp22047_c0_seq1/g.50894 comp22047_c0_seq1/m.50894 type:complete len:496 (+) comp22047_c0_seq1:541-2028(+)